MEWINTFDATNLTTAERTINNVPEWARAEHMEASSPLSELWKLSGDVSTLSPFHSSYK